MKVQQFLEQSSEPTSVLQLADLVDIFRHLNQLNFFLYKFDLWITEIKDKNFYFFLNLKVRHKDIPDTIREEVIELQKDSFESDVRLEDV